MPDVMLRLPVAPSVNELFFNIPGRGRGITKKYKKWRQQAGWELLLQRPSKIVGRYRVCITIPEILGDTDNVAKAPIDLLVKHGVVESDRAKFAREVTIRIAEDNEPVMLVLISPVERGEAA